MEVNDALRTTGSIREFTDERVADTDVFRLLDTARFAPSGGNRQGWRVIHVKDRDRRRALRDLYLPGWYEYLAQASAGLVPWAPITDREAERRAREHSPAVAAQAAAGSGGFAEHFDEAPVLLVVLADLRALAAVDRDLDRYSMAGGASVYPFVWSLLLAARDAGLGGVMTTMVIPEEDAVRRLLEIPDQFAVAAVLAIGHPARRPTRLRRAAVGEFTTVDRFDGAPLTPPA